MQILLAINNLMCYKLCSERFFMHEPFAVSVVKTTSFIRFAHQSI